MMLMDCSSPVCLDLSVGLSPSPPPKMGAEMADEKAMTTTLEANFTQLSEENRRLRETIAYLYANHQVARPSPDATDSSSPSPPPPPPPPPSPPLTATRKRSRDDSIEPPPSSNSGDAIANGSDGGFEGSCRRIKVSRVCTRIDPSDTTLTVKDGYHWRKYGQKVTRDNPSPRAYFRCAFAPSCPVKKKRSAEDSSVLVATYEGEHNHPCPTRAAELHHGGGAARDGPLPCSISINSGGPTITLDLTKNGVLEGGAEAATDIKRMCRQEIASAEFQAALVEQMASSLTRDSKFTDALAAAILRQLPDY
ncbi:unnamed protein product [Urochloa decumbens]|uniref:WRKY domain-containing protein n=1 Tax=Urochloa decumbens TaxID=240449 RepID=A0ABC9G622_9POAL